MWRTCTSFRPRPLTSNQTGFTEFSIWVTDNKLSSKHEFWKLRLGDNHTWIKGVINFVPVILIILDWPWSNSAYIAKSARLLCCYYFTIFYAITMSAFFFLRPPAEKCSFHICFNLLRFILPLGLFCINVYRFSFRLARRLIVRDMELTILKYGGQ